MRELVEQIDDLESEKRDQIIVNEVQKAELDNEKRINQILTDTLE